MKVPYHLLIVCIIALAGCGSTRDVNSTYRPATIEADTTILPKVVIPEPDTPKPEVVEKKYLKDEEAFKVSVLLPLHITAGDYKMPSVIADYYEGILLGLDSLKKMGLDVVMNVYDTKGDSATVKRLTWKPELAESHAIIGPTFKKGHEMLLQYVKPRRIALVSPFSNANMWSDSNHYALYCTPDENSYAAALAQTIHDKYPNAKLLLFNDDTQEDKDFLWRFKLAAKKLNMKGWTDITYKSGWSIEPHLLRCDTCLNVVIAPTDKSWIALQLLTQLKDPEIHTKLFVRDSWLDFNNINYQTYQLWQQNNLHVLTHYYVDDKEKTVMHFKALYKEKFGAVPNEFAYRGFDHIMALGMAYYYTLQDESVADALPKQSYQGMHNCFKFRFNGKALENESVNVIRFTDYKFLRVK